MKANEMHPIFMKSIKRNYLKSYLNKNVSFVRRQDIKPNVYRSNGAIYISRRDLILKNKNNLLYCILLIILYYLNLPLLI